MMRRDQLFEELGDKCSRERGKQEKGLQWGCKLCVFEKKASKENMGNKRESGGRVARSHRATKEFAVFPSVLKSH